MTVAKHYPARGTRLTQPRWRGRCMSVGADDARKTIQGGGTSDAGREAGAARRQLHIHRRKRRAALLGTGVLRAAVFRSVVLRAGVLRAAVFRAVVRRAAVLRAAVLRGAALRVAVFRAAVLRVAVLRVAVFRAAVLRGLPGGRLFGMVTPALC